MSYKTDASGYLVKVKKTPKWAYGFQQSASDLREDEAWSKDWRESHRRARKQK